MNPTGIAAARVPSSDIRFLSKITARAWAKRVDGTTDADANGSFKGHAAPRVIARSSHVGASTKDSVILGESGRNPPAGLGIKLFP